MSFQKSLKQAWEIVTLKENTMFAVAKDADALKPALIISSITTVLSCLGTYIFPSVVGLVTYRPSLPDLFIETVLMVFLGIASLYITGYLAQAIFHSKLTMDGYVRLLGYASLLNALNIFPSLSIISAIWGLIVMCFVFSKLGEMKAGSIILLLLLEIGLFIALGMIFALAGLWTDAGNILL